MIKNYILYVKEHVSLSYFCILPNVLNDENLWLYLHFCFLQALVMSLVESVVELY